VTADLNVSAISGRAEFLPFKFGWLEAPRSWAAAYSAAADLANICAIGRSRSIISNVSDCGQCAADSKYAPVGNLDVALSGFGIGKAQSFEGQAALNNGMKLLGQVLSSRVGT